MMIIFLVGSCMTFPILFPVNGTHSKIRKNLIVATGGGGQTGLDILSFANIGPNKNRYFAQVFVGWLFIGIYSRLRLRTDTSFHSLVPYS